MFIIHPTMAETTTQGGHRYPEHLVGVPQMASAFAPPFIFPSKVKQELLINGKALYGTTKTDSVKSTNPMPLLMDAMNGFSNPNIQPPSVNNAKQRVYLPLSGEVQQLTTPQAGLFALAKQGLSEQKVMQVTSANASLKKNNILGAELVLGRHLTVEEISNQTVTPTIRYTADGKSVPIEFTPLKPRIGQPIVSKPPVGDPANTYVDRDVLAGNVAVQQQDAKEEYQERLNRLPAIGLNGGDNQQYEDPDAVIAGDGNARSRPMPYFPPPPPVGAARRELVDVLANAVGKARADLAAHRQAGLPQVDVAEDGGAHAVRMADEQPDPVYLAPPDVGHFGTQGPRLVNYQVDEGEVVRQGRPGEYQRASQAMSAAMRESRAEEQRQVRESIKHDSVLGRRVRVSEPEARADDKIEEMKEGEQVRNQRARHTAPVENVAHEYAPDEEMSDRVRAHPKKKTPKVTTMMEMARNEDPYRPLYDPNDAVVSHEADPLVEASMHAQNPNRSDRAQNLIRQHNEEYYRHRPERVSDARYQAMNPYDPANPDTWNAFDIDALPEPPRNRQRGGTIGKFRVHMPKLHGGLISVSYHNGRKVPGFPNAEVSHALKKQLLGLTEGKRWNKKGLTGGEVDFITELVRRSTADHGLGQARQLLRNAASALTDARLTTFVKGKKPQRHGVKKGARGKPAKPSLQSETVGFNNSDPTTQVKIILGEMQAGNNSPALRNKLRAILARHDKEFSDHALLIIHQALSKHI